MAERHNRLPSEEGRISWYDVEDQQNALEQWWKVRITFKLRASPNKFSGRFEWWVTACAEGTDDEGHPASWWGGYGFRCANGAKTLAAACLMALHRLASNLEGGRKTGAPPVVVPGEPAP